MSLKDHDDNSLWTSISIISRKCQGYVSVKYRANNKALFETLNNSGYVQYINTTLPY